MYEKYRTIEQMKNVSILRHCPIKLSFLYVVKLLIDYIHITRHIVVNRHVSHVITLFFLKVGNKFLE